MTTTDQLPAPDQLTRGWAVAEAARLHPAPLFLAADITPVHDDQLPALPDLADALDALRERPSATPPRAPKRPRRRPR